MAVLSLSAYTPASLQNLQALLMQARAAGLTDVDAVIGQIADHLRASAKDERLAVDPAQRRLGRAAKRYAEASYTSSAPCPSCGVGRMFVCAETSTLADAPVLVCSRHCGYSEVVNG